MMTRSRHWILILAVACGGSAGLAQEPDGTAEKRLRRADAFLSPAQSFSAQQEVLFFKARKKERELRVRLEVLFRQDPVREDQGWHDLLVVILAPEQDRGKALLSQDGRIWFASPRARVPTQVSARHGVAGQLTIADLMRSAYLQDYSPVDEGSQEIRLTRDQSIVAAKLALTARPGSTGYPRVELFLDPGDDRPLQALAYDKRDRRLKTFFFRDYERALGIELPRTVIVAQATGKKAVHEIRTTSIVASDPPTEWFEPNRLLETAAGVLEMVGEE